MIQILLVLRTCYDQVKVYFKKTKTVTHKLPLNSGITCAFDQIEHLMQDEKIKKGERLIKHSLPFLPMVSYIASVEPNQQGNHI